MYLKLIKYLEKINNRYYCIIKGKIDYSAIIEYDEENKKRAEQLEREKPVRFAVEDLVHENGYSLEKAGEMSQMLAVQQGKSGEELADYIRRFCKRKWNSEFSIEMSRSCTEMVKDWLK